MIFKYNEKNKRKINTEFEIIDIYNKKNSEIDYVVGILDGDHGFCVNRKSTKYWIILHGNAKVYLDNEIKEVSEGDLIVINKNVRHNINGKVKFAIICNPPYDSNNEIFG